MWKRLVPGLIFFLPFQFALNAAEGFDVAIIRIIIPAVFLVWLADGLVRRRVVLPLGIPLVGVVFFIMAAAASALFAQEPQWAFRKLLFLVTILPLYVVLVSLFRQSRIDAPSVLHALSWSAFSIACLALTQFILQFVLGLENTLELWRKIIPTFLGASFSQSVLGYSSWLVNLSGETVFRAIALFPDPHVFAFYLEITLFIPLFLFLKERKARYLVIFSTVLLAALCSFSRGAYIGIMAGFGVAAWHILFHNPYTGERVRMAKEMVIFLFCLLVAGVVLFGKPVYERFFTSLDATEGSNAGRMQMWSAGWQAFREYPTLGVGLGNFPAYVEPSADYRKPIYAHNLYLDIAAELGIVGLVAWIAWFFGSLVSIAKASGAYTPLAGVVASLVAFGVHCVFDTPLFSVHILTLLCILLSVRYACSERTNSTHCR